MKKSFRENLAKKFCRKLIFFSKKFREKKNINTKIFKTRFLNSHIILRKFYISRSRLIQNFAIFKRICRIFYHEIPSHRFRLHFTKFIFEKKNLKYYWKFLLNFAFYCKSFCSLKTHNPNLYILLGFLNN